MFDVAALKKVLEDVPDNARVVIVDSKNLPDDNGDIVYATYTATVYHPMLFLIGAVKSDGTS